MFGPQALNDFDNRIKQVAAITCTCDVGTTQTIRRGALVKQACVLQENTELDCGDLEFVQGCSCLQLVALLGPKVKAC